MFKKKYAKFYSENAYERERERVWEERANESHSLMKKTQSLVCNTYS